MYPDEERNRRLDGFEFDGFVGIPFDDAYGYISGRAYRKTAIVRVATEILNLVFGYFVPQTFEVGKVRQCLENGFDSCRNCFTGLSNEVIVLEWFYRELFIDIPRSRIFSPLFQGFEVAFGDVAGFQGGFQYGSVVAEGNNILHLQFLKRSSATGKR